MNGKRSGRGFMHYPDGSTYDGEWSDNDKNGVGTYTYRNGDIYEGGWKDDQKHGKGVYTYKDSGTKLYGKDFIFPTSLNFAISRIFAIFAKLKLAKTYEISDSRN